MDYVAEHAPKYPGVDPDFIRAMIQQESRGNPRATNLSAASVGGAHGIGQFIPQTAYSLNIDPYDPREAVEGMFRLADESLKRNRGDYRKVALEYHGGTNPQNHGIETLAHADKVMRIYEDLASSRRVSAMPVRRLDAPVLADAGAATATVATDATGQPQSWRIQAVPVRRPRTAVGAAVDVGADILKGLKVGLDVAALDVREVIGQIPGVGPKIVGAVDYADQLTTGRKTDDILKQDIEAMVKSLSPSARYAMSKDWWDSERGTFGPAWSDPRAYMMGLTVSAPETVMTMLPAMRLAQAAHAGMLAAGMSQARAAALAVNTATVAGAVLEGSLGGASAARDVRDTILKVPEADLQQSEAYKALRRTMPHEQALASLADDQATKAFLMAGVATGAFGGMGDRLLAKIYLGEVKKGLIGRAVAGGVAEGFLEEFPQSGLSKMAENVAMQPVRPVPLTEGVLNEALGGLAVGTPMGAGFGALARGPERDRAQPIPAQDVPGMTPAPGPAPLGAPPPIVQGSAAGAAPPGAPPPIVQGPAAGATVRSKERMTEGVTPTQRTLEPALLGKESEIQLPSGAKVGVQYAIVDAERLVTSHADDLSERPDFPAELQPRARDRAGYAIQLATMQRQFNPEFLGESPTAEQGAPIVGADAIVESGNGRMIVLRRILEKDQEKATGYWNWLAGKAEQLGFDKQELAQALVGTNKPVLVRLRTTDVNRAEFARQANVSNVARMSAFEQALSDAKLVNMDAIQIRQDGGFAVGDNRSFIRQFVSQLPPVEQAEVVDAAGVLSQAGFIRLRNAILAKAYGSSELLTRMTETMEDGGRNLIRALFAAAPTVAKARAGLSEKQKALDITEQILAAVGEFASIQARGMSVEEFLGQQQLLGKLDPIIEDLLRFLADNTRNPRRIAQFILAYMDALSALPPEEQGALFAPEPVTREQLLAKAGLEVPRETVQSEGAQTGAPADGARLGGGAEAGAQPPAKPEPTGAGAQGAGKPAEPVDQARPAGDIDKEVQSATQEGKQPEGGGSERVGDAEGVRPGRGPEDRERPVREPEARPEGGGGRGAEQGKGPLEVEVYSSGLSRAKDLSKIYVTVKVIEGETGKLVDLRMKADEAIADVDQRLTKAIEMWECLKS
jgi:hypothetical protein